MRYIIILFGSLSFLAGFSLLIWPESFLNLLENNIDQPWLYILAIVIRLVIGVILLLIASKSKYPLAIKIIGILAILAGLSFLLMGQGRFQNILSTVLINLKPYLFIGSILAMVFGSFLIYAFKRGKHV